MTPELENKAFSANFIILYSNKTLINASTVFHVKRVDFEVLKLLGHNFLREGYQVTKFDFYILPHIHYITLQFSLITPKGCNFMASPIGNIRKIL